jgi:hypothetical protein
MTNTSRELKFRVWDVQQSKFLPSYADNGIMFHHEQGEDWHEKQVRDIVPVSWFLQDHNNNLGNYIVQQFTGLTDCKGNPIYEGDIVRGMFDFGPAGFIEITSPISWHNTQGYQWNYWDLSTIEIVGNIFEHKHLIEK